MLKFLGIIPARYASTRFPAKPLAMLGGKTVIQRVYEQVAGVLDDAYVVTKPIPRLGEILTLLSTSRGTNLSSSPPSWKL